MRRRVCIVGAGPAGLVCGRRFRDAGFAVRIFERYPAVGGTWLYSPHADEECTTSSLYQSLVTNLPMQVMAFKDFPFTDPSISFVHHTAVLDYITRYAENFQLHPLIQFNTTVTSVRPLMGEHSVTLNAKDDSTITRWCVTTRKRSAEDSEKETEEVEEEEEYDSVIVCAGHFFKPYIPREIQGIHDKEGDRERFPGRVMHSREYREPSPFKDQTVVIVGAGPSGVDITREVAAVARTLYVCTREREEVLRRGAVGDSFDGLPVETVHRRSGSIARAAADGRVWFSDGGVTAERVDAIIFCTGFYYSFPFLHPDCRVRFSLPPVLEDGKEEEDEEAVQDPGEDREVPGEQAGRCVAPVVRHILHPEHPSLVFIGLNFKARCVVELMTNHPALFWPTASDNHTNPIGEEESTEGITRTWLQDDWARTLREWWEKGLPQRYFHMLGGNQWDYHKQLETLCGLSPTFDWKVLSEVYNNVSAARQRDPVGYRKRIYHTPQDQPGVWSVDC